MTARPAGVPPLDAPVAAVIFDWGGTLTPWHTIDLWAQWTAFADGYGTMACARDDLASRLHRAEDIEWAKSRQEGHASATFEDILRRAGLDPQAAATRAGVAAYRDFWLPHTLTHPDVEPLFEGLRGRGLKVGVLSNTVWERDYHREIFERDGVLHLIDGDVYSSEIAHTKPHREIFVAAAASIGVPLAQCVYVGDREFEDIHGAHAAGMRAILIPHSQIPAGQLVDLGDRASVPDAVAHELLDILGILRAWDDEDLDEPA